ncbi:MAG: chloride channel protein [Pseudomonadales bacterium]|nr:chloride channel protein [Pseudomonadales bacterium]MDP6970039.1 chloride channel protein [Pseudomonadales bacterium]
MLERLALPIAGAALLGAILSPLSPSERRVGVVHVMERLSRHQGYLPLRNAVIQFLGGVAALVTGQSGGREGPAVHLGAASASLIGQAFELPNNSMRTLVACGTAAAIASSFNTPIAGVIFAMEVVMMEYAIASFIPVIIAAVTSTFLTHAFLGNAPAFFVPNIDGVDLGELPFIILAGLVIGVVAAGFIVSVQQFARLRHWPFWVRAVLAGAITGVGGMAVPEIMGIGYDTVNAAMVGEVAFWTLVAVVVLKSISNAAAVGLGLPVGLIGPTMVIGAAVGAVVATLSAPLSGEPGNIALYVILGMTAMMAAVLQAPLAALMAILEMTATPSIIPAAMLIIVVATLITSEVFGQRSVFISMLNTLGLQYPPGPVTQFLQRAGVTSIMNRDFTHLASTVNREDAHEALLDNPRWIVVQGDAGDLRCALNAADLRAFLEDRPAVEEIHLLQMPGMRKDIASIDSRATLAEAQELLNSGSAEALCIRRTTAPLIAPVLGVVTQEDIDNFSQVG